MLLVMSGNGLLMAKVEAELGKLRDMLGRGVWTAGRLDGNVAVKLSRFTDLLGRLEVVAMIEELSSEVVGEDTGWVE